MSRVFWKLCNSPKSLPESWAWGLHWLSEDTQEPFVSAIAVPLYSFSQHNGSLSRNHLFLVVSNFPLTFQSFPYHKLSHLYRICRYRNSPIMFKISTSLLLNTLRVSTSQFYCLRAVYRENMTVLSHVWVSVFRFSRRSGHSNNGASGEVNNDTAV